MSAPAPDRSASRMPRLYSVREVSSETRVPASTIYDAIAAGALAAVRIGQGDTRRGARLLEADVVRWIESRREVAR